MRRRIPHLLLAVLTVGSGLAAYWAVKDSPTTGPSSTFLSRAIATTVRAGTAKFVFTMNITGDGLNKSVGFGSVNFRARSADVYVTTNEMESVTSPGGATREALQKMTMQEVALPKTLYQQATFSGQPISTPWIKLAEPVPSGAMGPLLGTQAASAVSALLDQSTEVRFTPTPGVGSAGTGSVFTRIPVVRTCTLSNPKNKRAYSTDRDRLTVWLDSQGRIQRVRSRNSDDQHSATGPSGPIVTTTTLTFSSFGQPVAISAPQAALHKQSSGVATLRFRSDESCTS